MAYTTVDCLMKQGQAHWQAWLVRNWQVWLWHALSYLGCGRQGQMGLFFCVRVCTSMHACSHVCAICGKGMTREGDVGFSKRWRSAYESWHFSPRKPAHNWSGVSGWMVPGTLCPHLRRTCYLTCPGAPADAEAARSKRPQHSLVLTLCHFASDT